MPVNITNRTQPPAMGVSTQIDTLFVPAKVAAGKQITDAFEVRSLDDYVITRGSVTLARADNTVVYDGLDNFFREGGRLAVVATYETLLADALAKFTQEHGGGQVVAWSEVASSGWDALAAYAADTNRYALLDVVSTADTVGELTTAASDQPTADKDYSAAFGPWVTIGKLAGSVGGSNRTVPASSTVAALLSRVDALGNPNTAPAGRGFPLQNAVSTIAMSDASASALRDLGINPLRLRYGLDVVDGFRTSLDPDDPSPFWQANAGRARMWLQWNALAIGLNFEYRTIDGKGRLLSAFQGQLEGMCKRLYDAGGLWGSRPQEAYAVNTSYSVNTVDTVEEGQLNAVVEARFSMHAETVNIELVSVPISGVVGG
jgi:hypothetical protein